MFVQLVLQRQEFSIANDVVGAQDIRVLMVSAESILPLVAGHDTLL